MNDQIRKELISEEIISKCSNETCGGIFEIVTTFSDVIIIDLQLISRQENKTFSIDETPQELQLCGIRFKISALIEFIRDEDCLQRSETDIGHYIPHIKRNNDTWEKYDDLSNKIEPANRKRRMEVHTLFYIRN